MNAQPFAMEVSDLEMINGTRKVLRLLSGKWSVEVLYLLASGTRRYSEVLYEVGEVSKKTLTHTLRTLERDGLVVRRAFAEVPPRVEYSLTPLGWSLTGPLMALYEWAVENADPAPSVQRPHLSVVPPLADGPAAGVHAPVTHVGRPVARLRAS